MIKISPNDKLVIAVILVVNLALAANKLGLIQLYIRHFNPLAFSIETYTNGYTI
jgi:hypothetical protein